MSGFSNDAIAETFSFYEKTLYDNMYNYLETVVDRTEEFGSSVSNAIIYYINHPDDKTIAIVYSKSQSGYYINSPDYLHQFRTLTDFQRNIIERANLCKITEVEKK